MTHHAVISMLALGALATGLSLVDSSAPCRVSTLSSAQGVINLDLMSESELRLLCDTAVIVEGWELRNKQHDGCLWSRDAILEVHAKLERISQEHPSGQLQANDWRIGTQRVRVAGRLIFKQDRMWVPPADSATSPAIQTNAGNYWEPAHFGLVPTPRDAAVQTVLKSN